MYVQYIFDFLTRPISNDLDITIHVIVIVTSSAIDCYVTSKTKTERHLWIRYVMSEIKLEQLERLRSEDTPRRLMITHTIGSQVKKIIDLELKTLQSRHDFQSQSQMTLKI